MYLPRHFEQNDPAALAASYSSGMWSAVKPSSAHVTSVASGCARISAASAAGS
ncbi:MAG: hypothetical protein GX886_01620, partial [Comamonadaceae bacterium]|nr:hypothetical protein [Comamonadaceae bacterium]